MFSVEELSMIKDALSTHISEAVSDTSAEEKLQAKVIKLMEDMSHGK